jgi:predicted lipoprotein with Yx(FWY)xxD motif
MHRTRALGGLLALTVAITACGNNGDRLESAGAQTDPTTDAAASGRPAAPEATGGDAGALLGTVALGEALVGADGRSLYGFTNDTAAASTCYGTCADAWPPVIVDEAWNVGPGLDTGIFATTVRDDGQHQLVAGKWPLYYYTGDAAPGDINGQGSGDVWFLVDPDGTLIIDEPAESAEGGAGDGAENGAENDEVSTASTDLGEVLVDSEGLTLYGFTNDTDGEPSCYDDCADAWPPLLVEDLPGDLDPELFSVVEREDGELQLVAGKWPLYRFAGDASRGDVNGQGSGGVWFAADPTGGLIKDAGAPGSDTDADTDTDTDSGSDSDSDSDDEEAGDDPYGY